MFQNVFVRRDEEHDHYTRVSGNLSSLLEGMENMITIQGHLGIYQCNILEPITEDCTYFERAQFSGMKSLPTRRQISWELAHPKNSILLKTLLNLHPYSAVEIS